MVFDNLQDRLSGVFKNLRGKGRITESDIEQVAKEIRDALLEADVNLTVVREFVGTVRHRALGATVHQALNPSQQIIKIVNQELTRILGGETRRLRFAKQPPTVIMLAGLQGAGKTTLAGKLGKWLKDQGHSPLLVAADLQRPNAVNQLQIVGEQAGVAVFAPEPGNGRGNPVKVAKGAIKEAERKLYDVVIVDTAGRLGIDRELMKQASDIRKAVDPDEVLFVVDAMIGQDAVNTAKAFADGVGFDAVVLSKLDGDARGGAALSITRVTGKPIIFASTGEGLADFDLFHPDRMASRILGMGDILTLIEQAERTFDAEQSAKAAAKLAQGGGAFGLDDFLAQLQAVRKMGPLSGLLSMMPGMAQFKDQIANIDEREIDRVQAIIYSMTPAERGDIKVLNGSRRARIAKGAGVTVTDVNQLVTRFSEARKMMERLAGGGMPGIAGIPGARPSTRGRAAPKAKKKGNRVSGNPAKRNAAVAEPQPAAETVSSNPFGQPKVEPLAPVDPAEMAEAMKGFKLPPGLANLFGKS